MFSGLESMLTAVLHGPNEVELWRITIKASGVVIVVSSSRHATFRSAIESESIEMHVHDDE